jgi:hypothetical protein
MSGQVGNWNFMLNEGPFCGKTVDRFCICTRLVGHLGPCADNFVLGEAGFYPDEEKNAQH